MSLECGAQEVNTIVERELSLEQSHDSIPRIATVKYGHQSPGKVTKAEGVDYIQIKEIMLNDEGELPA